MSSVVVLASPSVGWIAMTIESFFAREPFHTWRKNNFVKSIAQSGRKRDPRLTDTPTIYELMDQYKTSEQSRRVATVILAGGVFGRPMVGPAGIAPDRLKTLRGAFASALKDPELKMEAEKRNYELEPVAGVEDGIQRNVGFRVIPSLDSGMDCIE